MYTLELVDAEEQHYYILDPDDVIICSVYSTEEAHALLWHLNRDHER